MCLDTDVDFTATITQCLIVPVSLILSHCVLQVFLRLGTDVDYAVTITQCPMVPVNLVRLGTDIDNVATTI